MKKASIFSRIGLAALVFNFNAIQLSAYSLKEMLGEERFVPRTDWDNTGIAPDIKNMAKHTGDIVIAVLSHTVSGSSVLLEAAKRSIEGLSAEEVAKVREERVEQEKDVVRDIMKFHTDKDGRFKFSDIGGHGFITPCGFYMEGRAESMRGSHTLGSNDGSLGLYFVGCYDKDGCEKEGWAVNEVTPEMIETAAHVVAYYSLEYGLDIEKQLAHPELTKENQENIAFWPRSKLDLAKDRGDRFPHSPGNLIIERLPEILEKALVYKAEYLAAQVLLASEKELVSSEKL